MLLMILKYCLIAFKGSLMILKCFHNDLSTSLDNFWSLKKLQRGRRPSAAAPLVVCWAPKFRRTAAQIIKNISKLFILISMFMFVRSVNLFEHDRRESKDVDS